MESGDWATVSATIAAHATMSATTYTAEPLPDRIRRAEERGRLVATGAEMAKGNQTAGSEEETADVDGEPRVAEVGVPP